MLVDLHAVEVYPCVHGRPSVAAITIVELVRVVSLVDVIRWLEGFLCHIGGHRGVVCLGLHGDETHGESRLHELLLLFVSYVEPCWWTLCNLPMRFPCWEVCEV
jgi:hypothetical protein